MLRRPIETTALIGQVGPGTHMDGLATLFETFPGFVWGTVASFILGAAYVFAFAWIFAWYFVWMHNTSLVGKEK